MKHGKKVNHLSRTAPHRKAMMGNMAASLLKSEKKRVITTLAKAKALRVYVEPLITKGKNNTTHSRRTVFSYLQDKEAVTELFGSIAAKIGDRPGGYTRILKLGTRKGDNAEMALIELVDYNEFLTDAPKKKTSRRRKKKPASESADSKKKEAKVEQPVEEVKAESVETVEEQVEPTEEVKAEAIETVEEEKAETVEATEDVSPEAETKVETTEEVAETKEEKTETADEKTGDDTEEKA